MFIHTYLLILSFKLIIPLKNEIIKISYKKKLMTSLLPLINIKTRLKTD
jgi:hypothetical protein